MKTIILTITCLFTLISINAETYTCSNHPLGGSQYSTFVDAYNVALIGDTILLENTDINYNLNFTFSKKLVIIGIGTNAEITDVRKTKIYQMDSSGVLEENRINSNGAEFHGIEFGRFSVINGPNNTFSHCTFSLGVRLSNIQNVFTNCLFNSSFETLGGTVASFISSIFNDRFRGNGSVTAILSFDHCLFLEPTSDHFWQINGTTNVQNSIFMNSASIIDASSSGINFTNNIFEQNVIIDPMIHDLTGNLNNTNPLFVNFNGGLWDQNDDYDVQSGSPATGAATDGTDIGLHGGLANFSEAMEPLIIPIVTNVTILNPTVAPGGTLNVQIEARTPLTD